MRRAGRGNGLTERPAPRPGPTQPIDAAGTGSLLAQVEGRASAATIAWLDAQRASWRAGITHVTIDLSASHAKAVREACQTPCWSLIASMGLVNDSHR